ncbi:uncharacterized protein LOC112136387 isoform X3 [Oryzias melastigma]|uniref:uncharacterized protein LOC112136387 isoform X3 n=1 Tax=Oryzias melastigma TaxID=30732 RepID=UPI00168CFA88|nr:uncharacterized protein LOC112136387 isoform X3 [Oryzias melastigma]
MWRGTSPDWDPAPAVGHSEVTVPRKMVLTSRKIPRCHPRGTSPDWDPAPAVGHSEVTVPRKMVLTSRKIPRCHPRGTADDPVQAERGLQKKVTGRST